MKVLLRVRVLCIALLTNFVFPLLAQDPLRFETEVQKLTAEDKSINKKGVILFTGSSSVRMWRDIQSYFPRHNIVNRGFGGSETTDLLYYFDKLILPYKPKQIFIYEGDNDINSGKTPEEILRTNESLVALIRSKVSRKVQLVFLTPKPSKARWSLKSTYEAYNQKLSAWAKTKKRVVVIDVWTPMLDENGMVMQDIFIEDGLHMNKKGYDIWASVIGPYLR